VAKRQTRIPEQRIAEYVDSPMMMQRVRFGKQISARILGNYGTYRTKAGQSKKVTGECTCPSDWWPCKHVHALRETWRINPHSFFDLDQFIAELFERPKGKLIEAIEQMIVASPEMLQFFDIPGFEKVSGEGDEIDEEDDWDE
jgi:hypothetical protein